MSPQIDARVLIGVLMVAVSACTVVAPALPPPSPAQSIGSRMVSPADQMLLLFVPEGPFSMGSERGLSDEQPVHSVNLDAFWIDQTEITNAMYSRCIEGGGCEEPAAAAAFAEAGLSDHPVTFVSWRDAVAYCAWADRRLPTEAEWEKAAVWDRTTGHARVYPWGDEYDCRKGNFDDEILLDSFVMPGGSGCDGYVRSSPVGSYPSGASPFGALDMAGNVWEWVHDAFVETDPFGGAQQNYYAISPPSNPQGVDPSISSYRVLRGGSWNMSFGFGRSTYRLWFGLDDRYEDVGFRCASSQ